MSVSELKAIAKSLGIKGSYSMKKSALITAIEGLKGKNRPAVLPDIEMEKPVKESVKEPTIKEIEKDVKEIEKIKEARPRKPNSWNDHIRAYRTEHSCSLREAMSKARETYGKGSE